MGRGKKREDEGKNIGPSLIGEGHTQAGGEDNYPLPVPPTTPPIVIANSFPKIFAHFCLWRELPCSKMVHFCLQRKLPASGTKGGLFCACVESTNLA